MYQLQSALTPPNLPGLNKLAVKLNGMTKSGIIPGWHLGRWVDDTKASRVILFDTEEDGLAEANRHV